MSIETVTNRTYSVKATCDQCGVVKTWDQVDRNPEFDETLDLGFYMADPAPYAPPRGWLWLHDAACVHAYVEANVIQAMRHPENTAATKAVA